MARNRFRSVRLIGTVLAFLLATGFGAGASGAGEGQSATYFSRGQAIYNAQDKDASRQAAVQDFLIQALTQAMGSFLSPSQLGSELPLLQEKILNNPQRYVETYQVFTETPAEGLYKINGQVTVTMDILKKDIEEAGIVVAAGGKPSARASSSESASSSAPAEPGQARQEQPQASRGIILTKQELYWAVSEKWDQQWYLPHGKRDPRGLFALGVMQEAQDFDWSIKLPEANGMSIEPNGNVSLPQVLSEAQALGISKAVVGTVGVRKRQDADNSIEARLRLLDVSTGRSLGEIKKTGKPGLASDQDDAVELATQIIPQLDNLLHEEGAGGKPGAEPEQAASSEHGSGAGKSGGKEGSQWTLVLHSDQPFVYLEELENLLKDRSKSVQIKEMEVKGNEIKLWIDGIDGQFLSSLQGAGLPSGAKIQVGAVSEESRKVDLSIGASDASQAEPGQ